MTQFQLYSRASNPGYLLDIQSDFIDVLKTRIVVPLLPADLVPDPVKRLHPVFQIERHSYVMATHLIATVPVDQLRPGPGSMTQERDRITAAIDMLFYGF